jgi:hypothetical protein
MGVNRLYSNISSDHVHNLVPLFEMVRRSRVPRPRVRDFLRVVGSIGEAERSGVTCDVCRVEFLLEAF